MCFLFVLSAVTLLFASCKREEVKMPPANLIEEDKMVEMVTEQLTMESMIFFAPQDTNKAKMTYSAYAAWFQKYGVTSEQFETSVQYYFADREMGANLMHRVVANVDKQIAKAN